jgi:tetratricopeptide (TPR) repeat protein
LGSIEQAWGNYYEAKELYLQSLEIERKLGNQLRIANASFTLGSLLASMAQFREAEQYVLSALNISTQLKDDSRQRVARIGFE